MVALKNVLVTTDFSEPSAVALRYGRELARMFGAKLHVLHVADSLLAAPGVEYYPAPLLHMQSDIESVARKQLDELITNEDRSMLSVQPVVRTGPSAAAAIVEYAMKAGVDLIVMGTHGRTGLSHVIMGSVAERVVRTAPCPVLTVRYPERDFVREEVRPEAVSAALPAAALG